MRRSIFAAIAGIALASESFAGFTVTATRNFIGGGFDRWDIVAINNGGDTGTQIKGLEYFYQGAPVAFEVFDADENGVNDTVNLSSTSRTRIRVAVAPSSNVYVGLNPAGQGVEPNPYENGLTAFSGAIANTGTTFATGTGFQIARLFVPSGSGVMQFSGNIGGDVGSKVPFSVNLCRCQPVTNNPVLVNNNASTNVVFGQIVSGGAAFSVQIQATDQDAGDVLALVVGALPAGISNITVAPATSGSPANFTISGLVDYSLNGQTIVVPITINSTSGRASGQFQIVVTPEPGAIVAVGLVGVNLASRRGRKLACYERLQTTRGTK